MKKAYFKPEWQLAIFENEDVITSSYKFNESFFESEESNKDKWTW